MDNPAIYACGLLCGVPAGITAAVILYFRALAKRHLTLYVEHSDRPTPELPPGVKRVTFHLDLEARQPRRRPEPVKDTDE